MMISQVMRRYKDIKFSWKFILKACCFIVFIFSMYYSYIQLSSAHHFPITEVKISGVEHIDHGQIQQSLLPLIKKGFFNVEVAMVRERLLKFPWVADAQVRRVWPNQLNIRVAEKIPLARWNHLSLLSNTGEIFTPAINELPLGLPEFLGGDGEQIYMMKNYVNISSILKPLHFRITHFELTQAGSWKVTFANGMKLNVSRNDVLARMSEFVKVYPKIVGTRVADVDYVDLRYPNGLVVRWKTIT